MPPIIKSIGTTESERFLARIAEKSFLSLWSYPNVFRGPAKELCDLLVVCGNKVIVFSDKHISWPQNEDFQISWDRWYRRAIAQSAKQLKRAIGWIKDHPDRIYLDASCKFPFPIDVPADELEIHGVIVARGAASVCREHLGGSGSLALSPLGVGQTALEKAPPFPFFIGNPSTDLKSVYHVLDEVTLSVLLRTVGRDSQ